MVVKIRVANKRGDQTLELSVEDAKKEIEIASKNGYIASYDGKQVSVQDVKDGQEVTLFPTGTGG